MAPLVQVAGPSKVRKDEHAAVLKLAHGRPHREFPADQKLRWLAAAFRRPVRCLHRGPQGGFSVLPVRERHERVERVIDACRIVAEASGTEIAHQLGLGTGVSKSEASLLDSIANKLRSRD